MSEVINLMLEDFDIDPAIFAKFRPVKVGGISYSHESKVVTDRDVYNIDLMPSDINHVTKDFFRDDVAYLSGDTYYLYRGEGDIHYTKDLLPGIYKDKSTRDKTKYFVVEPSTDYEKEEYDARERISKIKLKSLIDSANSNEDILIAIPESTKIFQPEITENDDILKIIAKKALQLKNVDLDRYKDRFSNKNELFNFKQVLRSDNKVSMKIFMRGMEALNLVFTIIVTEKSANNVVGDPLKEPIKTSSEETYEMAA